MGTGAAAAEAPEAPGAARWPIGPARPRLGPRELHVWLADLRAVDDAVQSALSAQERARAEAIVDPRARARWARSRGVLRVLLGRYLECAPAAVQIVEDERGKPSVASALGADGSACGPHFSLSHSGHLALYGFDAAAPLGVDVQLAREEHPSPAAERPPRDRVALARRTFGEREAARLGSLPASLREAEFLRLWARYEAEAKRIGVGIGVERTRLGARSGARFGTDRWVLDLDVRRAEGPPAAAAVAARGPRALRLWRA